MRKSVFGLRNFTATCCPHFQSSIYPKEDISRLKYVGSGLPRNVGILLPHDSASYPRRTEYSCDVSQTDNINSFLYLTEIVCGCKLRMEEHRRLLTPEISDE
jgi:hypothetical protein